MGQRDSAGWPWIGNGMALEAGRQEKGGEMARKGGAVVSERRQASSRCNREIALDGTGLVPGGPWKRSGGKGRGGGGERQGMSE
jgi:hypothetical protein